MCRCLFQAAAPCFVPCIAFFNFQTLFLSSLYPSGGDIYNSTPGSMFPCMNALAMSMWLIFIFSFAAIAMYVPHTLTMVRYGIGACMVTIYFVYVMMTLNASKALVADGHVTEAGGPMMLCRLGLPNHTAVIALQLLLGLALLIAGAKGFIHGVEAAADLIGISALLLSLLIIPIATELPEKVNSVLWIRKGKDTLAFGNITGAMVFQGTLLPAIGIMLTPWEPRMEVVLGIGMTLLAALWMRYLVGRGGILVWHLLINGLMYISYLVLVLS